MFALHIDPKGDLGTFAICVFKDEAFELPNIVRLENVSVPLHTPHSVERLKTLRWSRVEVLNPETRPKINWI